MDFWSNYISRSFQFCIRTTNSYLIFLVVLVPIVVMNKVSPLIPLFWMPNINNTKSMFIRYFNIEILVYIPTKISLCNHIPQFKNIVRPVGLLAHMGKYLLKPSITNIYVYGIFVEFLYYKVLIF